jgi:DNA-binding Lrp family transcriptional regulator
MLNQRDRGIIEFINEYKSITIKQTSRLFFSGIKYSYNTARKRLKKLEEMDVLKSYTNKVNEEKVYYISDKLSAHNLYVLEVYSLLIENGCEILEFKMQPLYLKKQIRPDAFIKFRYDNLVYLVLLEIDLTHFTGLSKFQMYEMLYRANELQNIYGAFPIIAVVGDNPVRYESFNFDIVYLSFKI